MADPLDTTHKKDVKKLKKLDRQVLLGLRDRGRPWQSFSTALVDDKVPGGRADSRPDSDFDPEELRMGIEVEKEHTKDPALAKEIAKDHLAEIPDYYTKLKKIDPHHEDTQIDNNGKITAGVFLPVPGNLALQFPDKAEHDDSHPHFTLLYVGDVCPAGFKLLVEGVRSVAKRIMPFTMVMKRYSEFTNPEGQTIPHMTGEAQIHFADSAHRMVVPSFGLGYLHAMLHGAVTSRGVEVAHRYGPESPPAPSAAHFKAHATLQYLEPGQLYVGPKPTGQWRVTHLEVWGWDTIKIPLGSLDIDQPR